MPPTGTEINISANVHGGFVQVNVIDQGPGIPPVDHKRVFQAFRRGANAENSSVKGAGLGLAICKGLVEAHGGRIWIKKKNHAGGNHLLYHSTRPFDTLPSWKRSSKIWEIY